MPRAKSLSRKSKKAQKSARVGRLGKMPSAQWAPLMTVHRFTRNLDSGDMNVTNGSSSAGATINVANAGLVTLTTPAVAGTSYYGLGLAFEFADLPGATEFTVLYDQYRIHHIELDIVPLWNVAQTTGTSGGNGNFAGYVHSVYDFDDATAPSAGTSGVQALQQFRSYRLDSLVRGTPLHWKVQPMVALAAYSGAFTSYAAVPPPWIDCNSAGVQHYGIKFLFEVLDAGAAVSYMDFRMNIRYFIEMRLQR